MSETKLPSLNLRSGSKGLIGLLVSLALAACDSAVTTISSGGSPNPVSPCSEEFLKHFQVIETFQSDSNRTEGLEDDAVDQYEARITQFTHAKTAVEALSTQSRCSRTSRFGTPETIDPNNHFLIRNTEFDLRQLPQLKLSLQLARALQPVKNLGIVFPRDSSASADAEKTIDQAQLSQLNRTTIRQVVTQLSEFQESLKKILRENSMTKANLDLTPLQTYSKKAKNLQEVIQRDKPEVNSSFVDYIHQAPQKRQAAAEKIAQQARAAEVEREARHQELLQAERAKQLARLAAVQERQRQREHEAKLQAEKADKDLAALMQQSKKALEEQRLKLQLRDQAEQERAQRIVDAKATIRKYYDKIRSEIDSIDLFDYEPNYAKRSFSFHLRSKALVRIRFDSCGLGDLVLTPDESKSISHEEREGTRDLDPILKDRRAKNEAYSNAFRSLNYLIEGVVYQVSSSLSDRLYPPSRPYSEGNHPRQAPVWIIKNSLNEIRKALDKYITAATNSDSDLIQKEIAPRMILEYESLRGDFERILDPLEKQIEAEETKERQDFFERNPNLRIPVELAKEIKDTEDQIDALIKRKKALSRRPETQDSSTAALSSRGQVEKEVADLREEIRSLENQNKERRKLKDEAVQQLETSEIFYNDRDDSFWSKKRITFDLRRFVKAMDIDIKNSGLKNVLGKNYLKQFSK